MSQPRLVPNKRFPIKEIVLFGFLPSFLKQWVYNLKGYSIGKSVHFGMGSVIIGKDVVIEEGSSFGFFSVVKADKIRVGRYVKIGATSLIDTVHFEIGDDARINEQVFVGGIKTPESKLIMGKRTIIMQMSFINPTLPIVIGDDTGIGGHCLLFTHGSWGSELEGFPVSFKPITIERKVWLPWRVFVMPGTHIGEYSVVAADSTVGGRFPARSLIAGSPAKVIKEDYVIEPSFDQKKEMALRRIEEFIDFLSFNGFKVHVERRDGSLELLVETENWGRVTFLYSEELESVENDCSGVVLVLTDAAHDALPKAEMFLSIEGGFRRGSSPLGEEFVSFISRYGVRFNRLDA